MSIWKTRLNQSPTYTDDIPYVQAVDLYAPGVIGARYGSTGNQRFLDLPGDAGDYAYTPDSVLVSVPGDITMQWAGTFDDVSVASTLLGRRIDAANNQSYFFETGTGGFLQTRTSPDGSGPSLITAISTSALSVSNGDLIYLKATIDVDNGFAGNDVKFYTSTDGANWVKLGATLTNAGVTNLFDGTAILEIGSRNIGRHSVHAGTVVSAQVYDGIPLADGRSKSVHLPGVSGDFASTPDSVVTSIPGDLDIRVHATGDDWANFGVNQTMFSKDDDSTTEVSWKLYLDWNGAPVLTTSADGTTKLVSTCTAAMPTVVADGVDIHIKTTLDVDNGAAGHDVEFYTSTDGLSWAQLGATVTTAGVTSIFDSVSAVRIGGGGEHFPGQVFSAQVYDGIPLSDGTSKSLALPGAVGDYAHTPDSATTSVTGDLEFITHLRIDDVVAANSQVLCAKWETGQHSWYSYINTSGKVDLFVRDSSDATHSYFADTSLDTVMADGDNIHIKVVCELDNGLSNSTVKIYTSTDGLSWAQLGITRYDVVIAAIKDSTTELRIGARPNTSQELTGQIHSFQLNDGIGGTLAADFNPERDASAGDATVTSSTTGEVWTIAGNSRITGLVADFNPERDASAGDATVTSSTTGEVYTVAGNSRITGLVADFNPDRDAALGASTVTSSTTGEDWTLEGRTSIISDLFGHPFYEGTVSDPLVQVSILSYSDWRTVFGMPQGGKALNWRIPETASAAIGADKNLHILNGTELLELKGAVGSSDFPIINHDNGTPTIDSNTAAASPDAYMMYSLEDVYSRFISPAPFTTSDHNFIPVRWTGAIWEWDNNVVWTTLVPRSTDLLVATLDFGSGGIDATHVMLDTVQADFNGIRAGYDGTRSDIKILDDWWQGIQNDGEFTVTGTELHRGGDWNVTDAVLQDAAGDSLQGGVVDYGGAAVAGMIRGWELDDGTISHRLGLTLPAAVMKDSDVTYMWPATSGGSGYGNPSWGAHSGECFAIPKTTKISSLGLSGDIVAQAIANALQRYGGHVVAAGNVIGLGYFDLDAESRYTLSASDALKLALALRRVTSITEAIPGG